MEAPKVKMKWRPGLALVIYTVLLAVMALPVAVIAWFRAVEATSGKMEPAEITALIVALAFTVVVAYVLTRTITTPINALIARTEAIARGGKAEIQPLDRYGTQEIATLSQSFLDLAGKLVDRTDYVRSFAMYVSHELKSPLTAIRGAAELLRDDDADYPMSFPQRQRFLDNIIADAKRLDILLSRLRELSNAELPNVRGQANLEAVLPRLREQFPTLRITAAGLASSSFGLPAETATIVLSNLAENAGQHGATELNIAVAVSEQQVALIVRDNGRGIAPSNWDRIFQPFFSTRREMGGTGMGLGIVRAMLGAYGGTIELIDSEAGAAFALELPKLSETG
ncbi:HAMP domain-containing sensor histidine kinase [Rhizobium sp. Leaf341]|uniref:HAMP domain-containing sensor histidine kinase n=1 Tax=Rhizobium sp. Leaf341 TaxID=1736344 RepID=UPI00071478F6|nr:HAMP domain-containing sensor histidine kinase [Rhizobium sp. Leaf341]KQR71691.1 histidine kinase [Rhizobium sp. Leaf341]